MKLHLILVKDYVEGYNWSGSLYSEGETNTDPNVMRVYGPGQQFIQKLELLYITNGMA